MFSKKSSLHSAPSEENGPGNSVIGPCGPVLLNAPAEFAECQNHDALRQLRRFQIVQKRLHGGGEFPEQIAMRIGLGNVCVVAPLRRITNGEQSVVRASAMHRLAVRFRRGSRSIDRGLRRGLPFF
jgi:hypothetical protein